METIINTFSRRKTKFVFFMLVTIAGLFTAITSKAQSQKIISTNGTITEILCALGFEQNIVGVDVTSTYPESMQKIKKIGHNRNLSSEGIISLSPTVVFGMEKEFKPELKEQLIGSGIQVVLFNQEYSIEGTKKLITEIANYTKIGAKAIALNQNIANDISTLKKTGKSPKVIFIYARGAGNLMVAGKNTSVDKMISLAGGINAFSDFEDYKPLTPEALVAANPDVIVMFESGLKSMGGMDGIMQVQGMAQTNAGKNKKVIEMDGQYLAGFGPRVGKAIVELSRKF